MNMISWLENWLLMDDTKIIYILSLIGVANIVDFLIGWINARFNKQKEFSSSKAILGITRKMFIFILLVLFIPFVLLLPREIGITSLYVLYTGYLVSEFSSILAHLGITNDSKDGHIFIDFMKQLGGGK